MMRPWPIVFGILVLVLVCGCVRTVPRLPEQTEANPNPVGILVVKSAESPPAVYYQRPPTGFVDGLLRGSKHGAVLGVHVGIELAKAFMQRGLEITQQCENSNRPRGCGVVLLMTPVMGLLALTATPPIVTASAGLQGGFTAHSAAQGEEWEQALNEVHEKLKIQATLGDRVLLSLSSCCPRYVQPSLGETPQSTDNPDTILETEVLELGLAEASSEELPEPNESSGGINPIMAKAMAPLNTIFQKSRSSLYMLVQTKLLRINDNSLLDQRQFGYLSSPRPYEDWAQNNAARFRAELTISYQSLADQIVDRLVMSAPYK